MRASEVSRCDQFQRIDLSGRISEQSFEAADFVFELAQFCVVAARRAAELRLRFVERRRANAVFAATFGCFCASFRLLKDADICCSVNRNFFTREALIGLLRLGCFLPYRGTFTGQHQNIVIGGGHALDYDMLGRADRFGTVIVGCAAR
jgi:hypothetical protein